MAAAAGATGRGTVMFCDAAVWDCGVGRSQLHFKGLCLEDPETSTPLTVPPYQLRVSYIRKGTVMEL